MSRFLWNPAVAWTVVWLCAVHASGATTNLFFAEGRIACEVSARHDAVPAQVATVLPIAMKAAMEIVGEPAETLRLSIRLEETPPFYKRLKALFQVEAFAVQHGDEIALRAGSDPLKLAFRLGHELAHWLVYKRQAVRPPLWLDEGLAQLAGAEAAEVCARVHKENVARPAPPKLEQNAFDLDELTTLADYPRTSARSAAFYWQAEALARAIRRRLGPNDFATYFGLLCAPAPPAWQTPLRERWYFSDWDVNWLAEQIRPKE